MTGQQLRNSILQEAIQGRLVPNVLLPGEKTGAELLQDILAERQKKENQEKGKKAKKLSLSIIEEEPWELPEGWCWTHIGDIFEHSAGKSLNSSKQSIGKVYPYLTTSNVYWEGINFDKVKEMPFTEDEYKKCSAIKDDILVCEGGDVGRSCIWPYNYSIGLQNHVHRLRAVKNVYVRFFFYVMMYFKSTGIITAKGIGIGGFSANALKGLTIPFPPLSIQQAIVEKIEALFPLVDEYDKAAVELKALNETLPDKLRKSVLQEAIHGNLVPNDIPEGEATAQELLQQILKERQDRENAAKGKKVKKLTLSEIDEEPWELPEGWCWCKLGDLFYKITDGTHSTPKYTPSGVPFISVKDISKGTISFANTKFISELEHRELVKRCGPERGDLLLTKVGTTGIPVIVDTDREFSLFVSVALCKHIKGYYDLKYILHTINSPFIQSKIAEDTLGAANKNWVIDKIFNTEIPLPPLSIQKAIVAKIEEVFAAIDKLKA